MEVEEEDLEEIKKCVAQVTGVDPAFVLVKLKSEAEIERRRQLFDESLLRQNPPTLDITILSSDYNSSVVVFNYLNSEAFLTAINAALADAGITIAEAGIATVVAADVTIDNDTSM